MNFFSKRCAVLCLSFAFVAVSHLACSSDGSNAARVAGDGSSEDDIRGKDKDAGPGATPDTGASAPAGAWWRPTNDKPIHWHWQLSDDFVIPRDALPNVTVYDVDGELTPASTVAKAHALGPRVKMICYFDAGAWESYRSDANQFPKSVIGKSDKGWDGHYWLDIRQLDVILPLMKNRMINWCKNKGFDAVEPDETEVWSNDSGFPITKEQNAAYHKALSDMAHSLGLSVGLKGNNTEAVALEPLYDWALTEQCWQYGECTYFKDGFLAKGKAVFDVEYDRSPDCASSNAWKMNACKRDLDVDGPKNSNYLYQPCVPDNRDSWQ